ncbi:MAG: hypothetical protein AB7S72_00025 [Draconibacterium sp.]
MSKTGKEIWSLRQLSSINQTPIRDRLNKKSYAELIEWAIIEFNAKNVAYGFILEEDHLNSFSDYVSRKPMYN